MNKIIPHTTVLTRILRNRDKRLLILQGGSRSSKTWSIFQYFIYKALNDPKPFTLTIARKYLADSKITLLPTFKKVLEQFEFKCTPDINPRRQEQIYDVNGCEFAFLGAEDTEKFGGREQDYAWVNEVMDLEIRDAFDQMEQRTTTQVLIDYNPNGDEHWVYNLQKRDDSHFFISTVLDNPFAPKPVRNKILGYDPANPRNVEQGTADPYMWSVYGLGQPAKLKGAIFTNWEVIDKVPHEATLLGYGLDFGFANDPTALVALYKWNNAIIAHELIYETQLINSEISDKIKELGIEKNAFIVADCAEPKSIEELRRYGHFGIRPSKKGRDSINLSINLLKEFKIYITASSHGLEKEMKKYKWRETRDGKTIPDPIDEFNHCIDAMRYLAMETLKKAMEQKSTMLSPEYNGGKYWLQPSIPKDAEWFDSYLDDLERVSGNEYG